MADQIPDARLTVLAATGHCPHLSAPQETGAAIDRFLAATQDYLPGTKMYGGLVRPEDRIDLIAWLKEAAKVSNSP